jgi:hypothetical protein
MYNHTSSLSVPQAIRELLYSNNLYLQALQLGIANYTALAHKMKVDVERLTNSNVNIGTIVVAIKRYADTLEDEQKKNFDENNYPLEGARMSLTGSIIDVDFDEGEFEELSHMLDEIFEKENSGYNLFQTNKQLQLFAEDIEEIRDIVSLASKKFDGKIKEGLSKITITFPSNNLNHYNLLSIVSDVLYNNRIPLHNAFFTPDEIVLILNNKDASKVYELLRAKITKKSL